MADSYEQQASAVTNNLSDSVSAEVLDKITESLGSGPVSLVEMTEVPTNAADLKEAMAGQDVVTFAPPAPESGGAVNFNLSALKGDEVPTVIILDTEANVKVTLPKDFGGTVALGDGDNKVNAANNKNDIAVQTGQGNDSVSTGSGSDTIVAASGADTVKSGGGSDTINIADGFSSGGTGKKAVFDGGAGNDEIDMSGLDITNIVKAGAKGLKFTLADGSVVQVNNIETFVLTNDAGQEVDVSLAGVKSNLGDYFG